MFVGTALSDQENGFCLVLDNGEIFPYNLNEERRGAYLPLNPRVLVNIKNKGIRYQSLFDDLKNIDDEGVMNDYFFGNEYDDIKEEYIENGIL